MQCERVLFYVIVLILFTSNGLCYSGPPPCEPTNSRSGQYYPCEQSDEKVDWTAADESSINWQDIEASDLADMEAQESSLLNNPNIPQNIKAQYLRQSSTENFNEESRDQVANEFNDNFQEGDSEYFNALLSQGISQDNLRNIDNDKLWTSANRELLSQQNPALYAEMFNENEGVKKAVDDRYLASVEVEGIPIESTLTESDGKIVLVSGNDETSINLNSFTFDDSLSFLPTGHVVINNYAFLKGKDIRKEGQAIIADTATGEIIINNINSSIENAKDTRITKSSFELSKAESVILENYV